MEKIKPNYVIACFIVLLLIGLSFGYLVGHSYGVAEGEQNIINSVYDIFPNENETVIICKASDRYEIFHDDGFSFYDIWENNVAKMFPGILLDIRWNLSEFNNHLLCHRDIGDLDRFLLKNITFW